MLKPLIELDYTCIGSLAHFNTNRINIRLYLSIFTQRSLSEIRVIFEHALHIGTKLFVKQNQP